MPDLRPLAAEVGAVVPEPVLVSGSLPARASDLDLLVRPAARAVLEDWLPSAGFRRVRAGWLRVREGRTSVVDLEDAADWQLDAAALTELFETALPLPGAGGLVRPAPRHALLVLARRLQVSGGVLEQRRLARGRRALEEEPDALTSARLRAAAWGCSGALEVLAADLEGRRLTARERRDLLRQDGVVVPPRWRAAVGRIIRRPSPRGVVIAVSGLDGAGKSTLIAGLRDALASVGLQPVVLWHRISYGRALVRIAAPVKAVLSVRRSLARGAAAPPVVPPPPVAGSAERPAPPGAAVWPLVVTLVHVLGAGTTTRWHLRRGRVVLRDRDVLDSLVHLVHRYGDAAPVPLHRRLLVRGMPRPRLAVLLDVPAQEAWRRKPEQFSVEQLARQRAVYLEQRPHLGVRLVDGTRPPAEIVDEVVEEALDVLRSRIAPRS